MSVPENIKSIASEWLQRRSFDQAFDADDNELIDLLGWIRARMRAEVAMLPATGLDRLVLSIAVELDLAPWSSKSELSDEDLAPARLLCRMAGLPDVENPHELLALRSKLERTETMRGNACAWALLYKRVSEGRPEPEGVRGTARPLSLALDDLDRNVEDQVRDTTTLGRWRARALKAESTLAEIRQTSIGQVLGFTQELMATLIGMLDPETVGEAMAHKGLAWCPECVAWVKFISTVDQNNEHGADCASCRHDVLEDCELGTDHVLAAVRHLGCATDGPPAAESERPEGAELLTQRDRQAINDVHGDCGPDIGDAFELRLIAERRALKTKAGE